MSAILKVRLGEYDVSVTTEQLPYEELDVSHIMVHPQFNNLSLANDIALLRFVRPARRRPHIDVACMPHPGQVSETEGTRCVVTGWGRKIEGDHARFFPLRDDFLTNFSFSRRRPTLGDTEGDRGASVGRRQVPGGAPHSVRAQLCIAVDVHLRRRRGKRRL